MEKMTRMWRSGLCLVLALCMLLGMCPMPAFAEETEEKPLVYVSIGDSMTNGYGLDGYDGSSGIVNYANQTYGNMFAAYLAGYTGTIQNDQVIFKGENGTVDHRQLAMSGMRAEDLLWVLTLDIEDEALLQKIYNQWANGNRDWSGVVKDLWFGDWGFKTGDFRTWTDFADNAYRYADGAARILANYNGNPENAKYYKVSDEYVSEGAVEAAVAGIQKTDITNGNEDGAYFPRNTTEANSIGGYKFLQVATEFYQRSVAEADVISLALGNTNFGTYMLTEIMDVVMYNNLNRFPSRYDIENVFDLANLDDAMEAEVRALIDKCGPIIEQMFGSLIGNDPNKKEALQNIISYCIVSYIVNYIGAMEAILAVNPDVEIIQIALMNAYAEKNEDSDASTIGDVVDVLYTPINDFLAALPTYMQANGKYQEAKFYYAEAPSVECLVGVFGGDFYKKDGQYIAYPGLLELEDSDGYSANVKSTVRSRFVENIVGNCVCSQQDCESLGCACYTGDVSRCRKTNGSAWELMGNFGVIRVTVADVSAYDLMTPTQKATLAATDADKAKSCALYLAFENATINAGKGNVTLDSLGALSQDLLTVFGGIISGLENAATAYGVKNYLDAAAAVVSYGSNGALTPDDVKALVLGGDAAIYAYIAARSGGQLTADQVKALYEAPDHDAAIYGYVANMSGGYLDAEAVKNLYAAVNAQETDAGKKEVIFNTVVGIANNSLLTVDVLKSLYTAQDKDIAIEAYITSVAKVQFKDNDYVKQIISNNVHSNVDDILACDDATHACFIVKTEYQKSLNDAIEEYKPLLNKAISSVDDLGTAVNGVDSLRGVIANVGSLKGAVSSAHSLCYLLGLPQTLSDSMFNDDTLAGILCMNARVQIGTGIGGHPSENGHVSLYDAMVASYRKHTSEDETNKNIPIYAQKFYDFLASEDSTYSPAEKVELLKKVYDIAEGRGALADYPEVAVVMDIYHYMDGEEYIGDDQTLDIVLLVYGSLLDPDAELSQDAMMMDIFLILMSNDGKDVNGNDLPIEEIINKIGEIMCHHHNEYGTFECKDELNQFTGKDVDHLCDYLCGKKLSDCADADKDHECDICAGEVGTHEAAKGKHTCDYCGKTASECADTNKDHKCDTCGAELSKCADANKDHKCDTCGKELNKCADANKDHKCDTCGAELSKCADANKDHKCDTCGAELSKCADANKDHKCDTCGKELSKCADANKDHKCDTCGAELSKCADANKDHKCDTCGKELSTPTEPKPTEPEAPTVEGVNRVSGENRYETAFAVADVLKEALGVDKFDAVIVASGSNFPDALAGTYLATTNNAPILVTNKNNVKNVQEYIAKNLTANGTVYILGGDAAVGKDFEAGLAKTYKVERLAGENRYYTNLNILKAAKLEKGSEILICTGKKFPDSLSASATGLPILMVRGDTALFDYQVEYLKTLGTKNKFIIIGGESAITPAVAKQLEAYGSVERIAGANRYETSIMIAERFFENPDYAVVATGKKFPDGLCGGSLAYTLSAPLILTRDGQEAHAADYMKDNKIEDGYILGGESAVADESGKDIFNTNKIIEAK